MAARYGRYFNHIEVHVRRTCTRYGRYFQQMYGGTESVKTHGFMVLYVLSADVRRICRITSGYQYDTSIQHFKCGNRSRYMAMVLRPSMTAQTLTPGYMSAQ